MAALASPKSRIVVAMSGGVDSSVAAALLKEQGHEVIGITMRLWTEARPEAFSGKTQCCGIEDVEDARRVAQQLDIPHYTLNLERPFKRLVVDSFIDDYAHGLTPNPCLNCNTFIKFDLFLERALALKADYIATGHYARRVEPAGGSDAGSGVELHRAVDSNKDQSYVLYTLTQAALDRTLFPVGDLQKSDVREVAVRHGLGVAEKPDSVDICFVPGGDYREFVAKSLPPRPGPIVGADGETLGQHSGIQGFTIGQRRGLGVTTGEPAFVTAIDPATDTVHLGREADLLTTDFVARDSRWFVPVPHEPILVDVKVRYRTEPVPGRVHCDVSGRVHIALDSPARAVAPGQAAVFYQGDRVIGGATIDRAPVDAEHV
jgi:tRNA-specific 2-thiouridylase